MEQQLNPFHIALVTYLAIDIFLLFVGGIRMTLAVKDHPAARKENPTVQDVEEFRPHLIKAVESKFYFPHHTWIMRHKMNDAMNEIKYKIENKKAR